jgi:hypothetical protein
LYESTFDIWKVVSNWIQFVPLAASELKLVTLTLGRPGFPYLVSPSNPGMPSAVPASAGPLTKNGFTVSKSMR